jgi:hypothetical protein
MVYGWMADVCVVGVESSGSVPENISIQLHTAHAYHEVGWLSLKNRCFFIGAEF